MGFWIALAGIAFVVFLNVLATPLTWRYPRVLQRLSKWTVSPVMGLLFDRFSPRARFSRKDIYPYFWPNGLLPNSGEWKRSAATGFDYATKRRFEHWAPPGSHRTSHPRKAREDRDGAAEQG